MNSLTSNVAKYMSVMSNCNFEEKIDDEKCRIKMREVFLKSDWGMLVSEKESILISDYLFYYTFYPRGKLHLIVEEKMKEASKGRIEEIEESIDNHYGEMVSAWRYSVVGPGKRDLLSHWIALLFSVKTSTVLDRRFNIDWLSNFFDRALNVGCGAEEMRSQLMILSEVEEST